MKLTGIINFSAKGFGAFLASGWLLAVGGCSDPAPAPAKAASAKPASAKPVAQANVPQAAGTNSTAWETNAVFDNNPATRRDPFFPGTTQKIGGSASPAQLKPRAEALLSLKSIIGAGARRCAGINDRTFMAGETASVRLSSGDLVRVKCLEITDRTVVVTVEGESEPKTLKLNQ